MSNSYTIIDALEDDADNFRDAANRAGKFYPKISMTTENARRLANHCDLARLEIKDLLAEVKAHKQAKENAELSQRLLQAQIDELRASNARLKIELEEGQMTALAMAAFVAGRLSK